MIFGDNPRYPVTLATSKRFSIIEGLPQAPKAGFATAILPEDEKGLEVRVQRRRVQNTEIAAGLSETRHSRPHLPGTGTGNHSALQELAAPQQQQVQDHLLNCRDCLELYLDVCSARAEAEGKIAPEKKPKAAWLAVLGHKVRKPCSR